MHKLGMLVSLWLPCFAVANDVEPRLYSNTPVGVNFISLNYARSDGEVTFDASVPVADVEGEIDAMVLSYSRGFSITAYRRCTLCQGSFGRSVVWFARNGRAAWDW